MSTFEDREKAFENKYMHDSTMQFKVAARRNKKLGIWAAELMGLSGAAAEAFAKEVVASDLEEAGEEDVFRKVKGDLSAKGVHATEVEIREKMAAYMIEAKAEIMDEA
jgi:hypothetical protein